VPTTNIIGQWNIKSLFDVALPKTLYSILITPSAIQLVGGCNNYSYNYTLNSSTQVIKIGASVSTEKACGNSDDQLYVNGINKIYKYVYNNANGVARLNFYDQTGNIGYALDNSKNSQTSSAKSSSNSLNPASQSSPLSAGNYLLLILSRRDLPRVIVTISGNTISYKGCNSIIQTFSPSQLTLPKSSISITGGPTTNNNCAVNNDLAYFGALNQARTYSYDANAGTVVFSNADGSEIATLNTAN
jgi:META domain